MRRLELGRVGIWAGSFDGLPMVEVREAAKVIDDLGFGTLWLPETTGREAMAQAGILLSATDRIVVATGIASIYARDAVSTAAAQRTLDEAFPGRFLLGLGVSSPGLAEEVRGHRFGAPVSAMRDYLDALDAAPFGPPSTMDAPPRVLAALGPAMLRLAGERAWGAHPLGMPVAHTSNARALLGPDALLAVTQLVVMPPAGVELARDVAAQALPNRRALLRELGYDAVDDRLVDALVVHGGVDDVARRVKEHFDAGADHVSLHVLPADVASWRALGARLLPESEGRARADATPRDDEQGGGQDQEDARLDQLEGRQPVG